MSRSVDLFIDSHDPIDQIAARIERLTRIGVRPGEVPGTWALDEGEVHADLRIHPFVDDGELVFERYRYALSSRVPHGIRPLDAPETVFLRLVSEALRGDGVPTLLVHDLQYRDPAAALAAASARIEGGRGGGIPFAGSPAEDGMAGDSAPGEGCSGDPRPGGGAGDRGTEPAP